ncbi:ParA family protein [Acetobacter orientalis]|uniref:ParA family protein n=1 Tax=Acetobacter orientalis TaxID=146474 RepID=UPI001177B64D|nr:ParA family protein [Acetobacter orientalis]
MEQPWSSFHPTICLLSAAGGCGKTTLAVNLFRPFLENPLMLFMGLFPEKMFFLKGMEAHFM